MERGVRCGGLLWAVRFRFGGVVVVCCGRAEVCWHDKNPPWAADFMACGR